MESPEYFAFISYKREDEAWAKWLQHELEHYRLPAKLRRDHENLPKEIRPVFRDSSELSSGFLTESIHHALNDSKYLIVICSPAAAQSKWVDKEIQFFIDLGKESHIIPFIVVGKPFSEDPEMECYPPSLLGLVPEKELLGIRVDEELGKEAALVKVISQMLGLRFDSLWQRREREKKKKRTIIVAISVIVATLSIIALVAIGKLYWNLLANQSRAIAEKAKTILQEGDPYLAMKLTAEVLPSRLSHPNRPFVAEAEAALREAYYYDGPIRIPSSSPMGQINAIIPSPDNEHFVILGKDQLIIWSTVDGRNLTRDTVLSFDGTPFQELIAYNPSGSEFVSGGRDGTLTLRDAFSGKEIASDRPFSGGVNSVAYSPDGEKILVSGGDLFQESQILKVDAHFQSDTAVIVYASDHVLQSAVYSPDGKMIAFADGLAVRVMDADTGEELAELMGSIGHILYVAFSPDGKRLVSGSFGDSMEIWDIAAKKSLRKIEGGGSLGVFYSPDGRFLYSNSLISNGLRVWDPNTGEELTSRATDCPLTVLTRDYPDEEYSIFALSPNGTGFAGTVQGYCRILYPEGMRDRSFTAHDTGIANIVYSPTESLFVSVSDSGEIKGWKDGEINAYATKQVEGAKSITFNSDGSLVAVGTQGGEIVIMDSALSPIQTLQWENLIDNSQGILGLCFDDDKECLIAFTPCEIAVWTMSNWGKKWEQKIWGPYDSPFAVAKRGSELLLLFYADNPNQYITRSDISGIVNIDALQSYAILSIDTGEINETSWVSLFLSDWSMILSNGPLPLDSEKQICYVEQGKVKFTRVAKESRLETVFELGGPTSSYTAAAFSPGNGRIVVGDKAGRLQLVDYPSTKDLISQVRERFKDNWLTDDEKSAYYLK